MCVCHISTGVTKHTHAGGAGAVALITAHQHHHQDGSMQAMYWQTVSGASLSPALYINITYAAASSHPADSQLALIGR